MGYSNFNGGSEIESGCIPNLPGGSVDASGEFFCSSGGFTVNVQFLGGTLPIFWATNIGEIVTTGARTAQVHIDRHVDLDVVIVASLGTLRNACALTAYIARGRAKHHQSIDPDTCEDTAPPGGLDECQAAEYNCKGERMSQILDIQVGGQCTQAGEDAYLAATGFKYSNCPPFTPAGWPPTCQEDATALVCAVPRCGTGSYNVVDYTPVAFAACNASTPTFGSANFGAVSLIATLYDMVGSGTIALCDTRLDELKEAGCSPCALVHSLDVVVTAVDAGGNVVITDIPINA